MKLTLKEIYNSQGPLQKIISFEMDTKGKYWVAKHAKKLFSEIKTIDDRRIEILKKYGKKNKNGFEIQASDTENMKKFTDEFGALLEEEIEVNIQKIKFEYFEPLKISPAVLMGIDFLIEEPKDAPKETKKEKV